MRNRRTADRGREPPAVELNHGKAGRERKMGENRIELATDDHQSVTSSMHP